MKVLVLGASGIVGQHLRVSEPQGIEAIYHRRTEDAKYLVSDLTDPAALSAALMLGPDVIVNLAGENRPDVVEQDPKQYRDINVGLPQVLATWATRDSARRYVHVSTQGVFSGNAPPYGPRSPVDPVNAYGMQKAEAETLVRRSSNWIIARLTVILGIRIDTRCRTNVLEQMIEQDKQRHVIDRWFSPLFAADAARGLWALALEEALPGIVHLGIPERVTRYSLACMVKQLLGQPTEQVQPVSHTSFEGLAPRPRDTTWSMDSAYYTLLMDGLRACIQTWKARRAG